MASAIARSNMKAAQAAQAAQAAHALQQEQQEKKRVAHGRTDARTHAPHSDGKKAARRYQFQNLRKFWWYPLGDASIVGYFGV